MKSSWLVQRLKKPYTTGLFGEKDNPFAFGGGLHNGGLSDEAMDLLRGIFSFDYMGAAEFEFGSLPKALQEVAKNSDQYLLTTLSIPLSKVPKGWRDKSTETPTGEAVFYVICRKGDVQEVHSRIKSWAFEPYEKTHQLKESTRLPQTLRHNGKWETAGWLELDNGFFFFLDKEMWEKTASMFGITSA